MSNLVRTEIDVHGIRVLLDSHPEIQDLRKYCKSTCFGDCPWTANWLLISYFKKNSLPDGVRIMEIGCGWGLPGIFCAKKYNATVVSVDIDPNVFPYLRLHARCNRVDVETVTKSFEDITEADLENIDLFIASDVCFLFSMVDPLKKLIHRTLCAKVHQVLIGDRGRPPFYKFIEDFIKTGTGEIIRWSSNFPFPTQGEIFKIGSL